LKPHARDQTNQAVGKLRAKQESHVVRKYYICGVSKVVARSFRVKSRTAVPLANQERLSDEVWSSSARGLEFTEGKVFKPSADGSYDAIRVYLWAGLLDPATPGRDAILHALTGMAARLRTSALPPEKVSATGRVTEPNGPIGFSAALLPYLVALGEQRLEGEQRSRLRSAVDTATGLYGAPARYYDQNLALFALGAVERQFWFDANGALNTRWNRP
jgi:hypothetical protein